jgi:putative transcriptional regulator
MTSFGEDLIQAMTEAVAHARGEGSAIAHVAMDQRDVRQQAKLTQVHDAGKAGFTPSLAP